MFDEYIFVLSRTQMVAVLNDDRMKDTYAVISISDEIRNLPLIKVNRHFKAVLQMAFHDIDGPCGNYVQFNSDMARRIADFVYEIKDKVAYLIVHCDAGISRSAGVAAAIANHFFHDDMRYFRSNGRFLPNRLVYRLMIGALEEKSFDSGNVAHKNIVSK